MSGDRADKRDGEVAHATTAPVAPGALATPRGSADDTAIAPGMPAPSVANVELPPVLATRYELKRVVGAGGMGLVYEALDLNLHRHVALKVLKLAPTKPEERAEAVNRLVREARAMAALSHKNVVTVHDVGYHEDQVYVAMQFVDGVTLRRWLETKRSTQEILHVLYEAGSGLAAAHAARIIHRDFKPDNILVSQRRTVRVTDFGLARRSDGLIEPHGITPARISAPGAHLAEAEGVDVTSVTRSGAIVGTPAYMAPEQAQGQPCDARADQFSFCVTAWEALFGARPFPGKNWSEIYAAVQQQAIELAPLDYRKAPRSIQKALRRGMSVHPDDRFPSMVELLEIFEDALRAPLRRRYVAFGAIAVAAVVVAVIVTRNLDRDETPRPVIAAASEQAAETPTSTLIVPDTSRRNMQIAIRSRGSQTPEPDEPAPAAPPEPPRSSAAPAPAPPPAPAPATRPRAAAPPPPTNPAPPSEPPRPEPSRPDPRLEVLRAALTGLDAEYARRELLATDLPEGYRAAKQAIAVALERGDAGLATSELDRARAAIAGVKIDRAFIDAKVQRINARIPRGRQSEFTARLGEVMRHFNEDDFVSANRKINSIARDLSQ